MPTLAQTKPPCKHCKLRHENCWDRCVDYQEYKKVHESEKRWQYEQFEADSISIRSINKINQEKRRRSKK